VYWQDIDRNRRNPTRHRQDRFEDRRFRGRDRRHKLVPDGRRTYNTSARSMHPHTTIKPPRSRSKLYAIRYGFGGRASISEFAIKRTAHSVAAAPEYVRVNLSRAHVLVPEQLLHGTDVVARFEQVGGEAVAKRVAGGRQV
jgi:hypothetical protein